MNFIQLLDYNTTQVKELKYEILSFEKIVENYFGLNSVVSDRIQYILKKVWPVKLHLFHNARYENIIIGITLYVMDEFYDSIDIDRTMEINNVSTLTMYLYGDNAKSNLIQIYRIRDIISNLVDQTGS